MRAEGATRPEFLNAPGELPELIGRHPWAATSLGPIETWPQSLRTVVGLILRSAVPIVLLWGEDGVMIYNDAYSGFAGGRHPGLLGSKVREGWPEVADFNDNVMRVGLAGGTLAYRDQELTLHRTGRAEQVWMNLDYSPVPGDDGRPQGVIAIVIETTDRVLADRAQREATAALSESERRLRFLDTLEVEVGRLTDADAILAKTTRMVGEHLGLTNCAYADMDEDEDGFTIRGDWAAEGSPSIVGHYRLADFGRLAVERLGAGEPLVIRDNLKELDADEAATFQAIGIGATICMPLVKQGRLTALMAIHHKNPRDWSAYDLALIREVTERSWAHVERVGAEAELRAREASLRELNADLERQVIERTQARGRVWQVTPDLMGALNAEGYMETSNPAWRTVLGWSEAEVARMSIFEMMHPDDVERTRAAVKETLKGQPAIRFPNRYRCKDGSYRWISWIGVPEDGMVYCIGRDITEEKAAEAELAQAQEALRQAQKMEAVGQLTGGLAHDFNNLLAGIVGSLDLLQRQFAEGRYDGAERYVGMAQASAKRAASLTQRLLAFSRRQTLDPRPTDTNRLVVGMEELLRRTVGPGIEVHVDGAPDLWLTRVDAAQLESSLLNLVINARDAMPDGGRILIETANATLDPRAAKTLELPPGEYVRLRVTDTGSGMTPEVAERAFDPFFTTKPLGQGTGLGLSMIHGFVRQSEGAVRIHSQPGMGCTVTIHLPRFAGELDAPEAVEPQAETAGGAGETVLVIDDEETIRMLVVEVLEEAGYRVLEAGDGPSGLDILRANAGIDLLVTDVGLPGGMNGRQVADAARALQPGLKVLFITGYAENAVLGSGSLEPGMRVITKPFAVEGLGGLVREIIES